MASTPVQDRRSSLVRDALQHRWRHVLALALLGLVAGLLMMLRDGQSYVATSQVLVNPIVGNAYSPDGADDLEAMDSEAQVVFSDDVVDDTAAELGLDAESSLLTSAVSADVVPNTQVVQITVAGEDADSVEAVADSMALHYLDVREELAADVVQGRVERLQAQIAETERRLRATSRRAATAATTGQQTLQRLADGYQTDLFNQRAALTELVNTDTEPGRVLSPAGEPGTESLIALAVLPAGGLVGGALLGAVVAIVRERRQDLVRGSAGVRELGVRVLVEFSSRDRTPAAINQMMRVARLHALEHVSRPAVVVVASPGDPDDTSRVAGGLALAFARIPVRTVLVQATDVHLLGTSSADQQRVPGLSDAVLHDRDPTTVLQPVEPALTYLPTGRELPQACERFLPEVLHRVLNRLRTGEQLVLVQSPALNRAEGEALAGVADAVILAVTRHRTSFAQLEWAAGMLQQRNVALAGAILVDPDQPRLDEWEPGRQDSYHSRRD
jgi:uncharacterized protein involved in exopolysaccharide biosynthesis/Mrp family chromosome partitioning ATPase